MRVLLVKPYNLSDHIQPSLGLGYLATAIRSRAEVRILDCIKENIKIDRFQESLRQFQPDIVGIQCYTFDLGFVKSALSAAKGIGKDIVTIVGGPHPSAAPKETFEYFGKYLDFAFLGESEISLCTFLDSLKEGRSDFSHIPGFAWRKSGSIATNNPVFHGNLDSFNFPAWDMIRPETYPESQHGAFYKKFPIAPIMLTRGCPYQCTFCAGKVVSGVQLRKRSIEHAIEEVKLLYHTHGIREFHIVDDNFTMDINYAKTFFRELQKLNLDISLATPNGIRMDALDEELLQLMKSAGVYLVSLGIESGSNRILKSMKKNLEVEKIKKQVDLIARSGLDIAGFFILGFPDEKKQEMLDTIKLSLKLKLIRANFFTYLPFPGTESYKKLLVNNELSSVDWDSFYFMNAAYTPGGMTKKELKRLQRAAFFRFYLRPVILWRNLNSIRSFRHLKFLLKRFHHWIIMS